MQTTNVTSAHKNSTSTSKLLVISRDFKAPVEDLFAAFASSDAIQEWWWPAGMFTDRVELEFREGGRFFVNLVQGDKEMNGSVGEFETIVPNKLIVMTDNFADKDGNVITAHEAGQKGVWPETGYSTFEFSNHGKGSRLVLSQEGVPNEAQADCFQGWSQMFDKLADYLARSSRQ